MPNPTSYFVDANIVLYAVGKPHPLKYLCNQILIDAVRLSLPLISSTEMLQEILHIYTSRNQRERAREIVSDFIRIADTILSITLADFERALKIHEQHPKMTSRDCLHVATMYNHGLAYILSADRHFDDVSGIMRIDPSDWPSHIQQYSFPSQNGH